ncbi:MAG: hypothetical protein C0404_14360, partial [Verrucomicrobia bacterium]|nr:hypothetical protein [Verrucomicrobiota bacterium]
WVVVVESLEGSGFPSTGSGQAGVDFVKKLFHVVRPYGGRAWLPLSTAEHAAFQGWVASAGLSKATVLRAGNWTILERTGALAGSIEFTATGGTITTSDQLARAPFAVSWHGNAPAMRASVPPPVAPDVTGGRIITQDGKAADVYSGFQRMVAGVHSGGKTVSAPVPAVSNPLFDIGPATGSSGSGRYGTLGFYGNTTFASAWYYDYAMDSGAVYWGGYGTRCVNVGGSTYGYTDIPDCIIPANGMYIWAAMQSGCSCLYGISQAMGLYHREDVENWMSRSRMGDRTGASVEEQPLRKVGINFGAPASRLADDHVLWLDVPRHQPGESPVVATFLTPAEPEAYYNHSGWIGGDSGRKWVVASGVKNMTRAEIQLSHAVVALPAGAAPVVDGNLADACWDGQSEVQLNWNQRQAQAGPGYQKSRAMARYDSENLYVSIEHPYVTWTTSGNDDFMVHLLNRDQVGLEGSGAAISFKVTRAGEKTVAGGVSLGSWTNDWSGVYAADTNSRRCEFSLPWSTLKAAGLWSSNLVVNLSWNSRGGGWYNYYDGLVLRQGGYSPLYLGSLRGLGSQTRPYNVKLYFAETEGAAAGQRVFNVKLQGNRVLSNFDVAAQAGGQNLALVKEFSNIGIADRLAVELEGVVGQTMISGVELVGTWNDANIPNQPPVAGIEADVVSGPAPLAVTLSAWGSYDPDGQIVDCRWDCGDGAIRKGSRVTHVFTEPGTYTVSLAALDERGGVGAATTTITVGSGAPAAFVSRIRATGGDYTKLSTWEAAIRSDLTSETTMFTVSDQGGYTNTTDNMKTVTFPGGGTGLLRWIDTNAVPKVAAIANCRGTIMAGVVTNASKHTFTIGDTGTASESLLFIVSNRGTYDPSADDGKVVAFAAGGIGYLRHINTENVAYITECRGGAGSGTVTVAGGHTFTVSGVGNRIYTAVAECYNDWPVTGLVDAVTVSGWLSDEEHCPAIRAAAGHGHTGRIKDENGKYTGFALKASTPGISATVDGMRVSGVIIDGKGVSVSTAGAINRVIARGGAIGLGGRATAANSLAIDAGFTIGGTNAAFYNCTSVDAATGFACNWSDYSNNNAWFVNCLARPKAGGVGFALTGTRAKLVPMSHCASSDGTADDWAMYGGGREWNLAGRTFSFVNEAQDDFRLAGTDAGACGWATAGLGVDLEGQIRQSPCDIGADEAPDTGDFDADGIPDSIDPDDDNDGIPDAWESANGLNQRNASDAAQDADGDGMTNLQEYVAGTDPANAASRFQCSVFGVQGGAFGLRFLTVAGRTYGVIAKGDLGGTSQWSVVANGIAGTGGYIEVTDSTPGARRFYRITVR